MRLVHRVPLGPANQRQAPPVMLAAEDCQADRYSSRPTVSMALGSTLPAVRAAKEKPERLGERGETVAAEVSVTGSARQTVDAVAAAVTVGPADLEAKSQYWFRPSVAAMSVPVSTEGPVVGVEMEALADTAVVGVRGGAAPKVDTQAALGVAVLAPEGVGRTVSSLFETSASHT